MKKATLTPSLRALRYDLPASLVVFLVALPLCMGIALASGAPVFAGLIAGIVGGIVIGLISGSPLSVSGPAAGLTVIVLGMIQGLPAYEAFLLAVVLAGAMQVIMGYLRAGIVGDFIPTAVIKGMLAAIGLILILKQIPHAVGYDKDYEGDFSFWQSDGRNTFSELIHLTQEALSMGAILISVISLAFLFLWYNKKVKSHPVLQFVPGPLVVVLFGVAANEFFKVSMPGLSISAEHLVNIPVAESAAAFFGQFQAPDLSYITLPVVWKSALTLALVASIETLLSIEAVDKLDPYKRVSPSNRELIAQGVGNMTSGMLGGIPVTSVIVRSSANVSSGGRTKLSAILHGFWLLLAIITIPQVLNRIPYAALAAILIAIGYKLTTPAIYKRKWAKGRAHFIPFVVTILAILFTDLLTGVLVGLAVGAVFVVISNFKSALTYVHEGNLHLIRFKKDLSFIHKYELRRIMAHIPDGADLMFDLSKVGFVDLDIAELMNDFIDTSQSRGITVSVKRHESRALQVVKEPPQVTPG